MTWVRHFTLQLLYHLQILAPTRYCIDPFVQNIVFGSLAYSSVKQLLYLTILEPFF